MRPNRFIPKTIAFPFTLMLALLLAFAPVPQADVSGSYTIAGGSGYAGTLKIKSQGNNRYYLDWLIGNGETYTGQGLLDDKILVVGWGYGDESLGASFLHTHKSTTSGRINLPTGALGKLTLKDFDPNLSTATLAFALKLDNDKKEVKGTVTVSKSGPVFYLVFEVQGTVTLYGLGLEHEDGLALAITDDPGTPYHEEYYDDSPSGPATPSIKLTTCDEPDYQAFTTLGFGMVVYTFTGNSAKGIWCMNGSGGRFTENLSK